MSIRFAATATALDKGVETVKPAAAVKLIDDWEAELKDIDVPGAKGIAGDLERLKKALSADEPDAEKVKSLVHKLGKATTKIAERADAKSKDKLADLGKALSAA